MKLGWVERVPDPGDRQSTLMSRTDLGLALIEQVAEA